jgi:hypothetical protein
MIVLTEEDKANVDIITTHAINRFIERSGIDYNTKISNMKNIFLVELDAKTKKLEEDNLLELQRNKILSRIDVINKELNNLELNFQNNVRTKIENLLRQTKRIYPKNYTLKLLNNQFENADYFLNDDYVFVVSNKVLKTIMVYDKNKWSWYKQ